MPQRIETTRGTDSYISTFYVGDAAGVETMVIAMKRKVASKAGNR